MKTQVIFLYAFDFLCEVQIKSMNAYPLRLQRIEAMPMSMLATERALAAFFRANSFRCTQLACSFRSNLLASWKKATKKKQKQKHEQLHNSEFSACLKSSQLRKKYIKEV